MRRHMLCVRRGRSDFCVQPGRLEALRGERRIIVKMDKIMCDAWMLRLTLEDRFEDLGAFELIGIGLVSRRSRGVKRERVENLRLVVVRIALGKLPHGLGI